jgi:hypothetical protein
MNKLIFLVSIWLSLPFRVEALTDPLSVVITDSKILSEYKKELNKLNVEFELGNGDWVVISRSDLNHAKIAGNTIYNKFLTSDVAAGFTKFMKTEVESYLIQEKIEFRNICFLNGVYTLWSPQDYPKVQLAQNNAMQKIRDIWATTPKSEWGKKIDGSVVTCP